MIFEKNGAWTFIMQYSPARESENIARLEKNCIFHGISRGTRGSKKLAVEKNLQTSENNSQKFKLFRRFQDELKVTRRAGDSSY